MISIINETPLDKHKNNENKINAFNKLVQGCGSATSGNLLQKKLHKKQLSLYTDNSNNNIKSNISLMQTIDKSGILPKNYYNNNVSTMYSSKQSLLRITNFNPMIGGSLNRSTMKGTFYHHSTIKKISDYQNVQFNNTSSINNSSIYKDQSQRSIVSIHLVEQFKRKVQKLFSQNLQKRQEGFKEIQQYYLNQSLQLAQTSNSSIINNKFVNSSLESINNNNEQQLNSEEQYNISQTISQQSNTQLSQQILNNCFIKPKWQKPNKHHHRYSLSELNVKHYILKNNQSICQQNSQQFQDADDTSEKINQQRFRVSKLNNSQFGSTFDVVFELMEDTSDYCKQNKMIRSKLSHDKLQQALIDKYQQQWSNCAMHQIYDCDEQVRKITKEYNQILQQIKHNSFIVKIPKHCVPLLQDYNEYYNIDMSVYQKKQQSNIASIMDFNPYEMVIEEAKNKEDKQQSERRKQESQEDNKDDQTTAIVSEQQEKLAQGKKKKNYWDDIDDDDLPKNRAFCDTTPQRRKQAQKENKTSEDKNNVKEQKSLEQAENQEQKQQQIERKKEREKTKKQQQELLQQKKQRSHNKIQEEEKKEETVSISNSNVIKNQQSKISKNNNVFLYGPGSNNNKGSYQFTQKRQNNVEEQQQQQLQPEQACPPPVTVIQESEEIQEMQEQSEQIEESNQDEPQNSIDEGHFNNNQQEGSDHIENLNSSWYTEQEEKRKINKDSVDLTLLEKEVIMQKKNRSPFEKEGDEDNNYIYKYKINQKEEQAEDKQQNVPPITNNHEGEQLEQLPLQILQENEQKLEDQPQQSQRKPKRSEKKSKLFKRSYLGTGLLDELLNQQNIFEFNTQPYRPQPKTKVDSLPAQFKTKSPDEEQAMLTLINWHEILEDELYSDRCHISPDGEVDQEEEEEEEEKDEENSQRSLKEKSPLPSPTHQN